MLTSTTLNTDGVQGICQLATSVAGAICEATKVSMHCISDTYSVSLPDLTQASRKLTSIDEMIDENYKQVQPYLSAPQNEKVSAQIKLFKGRLQKFLDHRIKDQKKLETKRAGLQQQYFIASLFSAVISGGGVVLPRVVKEISTLGSRVAKGVAGVALCVFLGCSAKLVQYSMLSWNHKVIRQLTEQESKLKGRIEVFLQRLDMLETEVSETPPAPLALGEERAL